MPSMTFARILTSGILVACAAFGGYATLGVCAKNGLLDALTSSSGYEAIEKYFLGGPTPYMTTYTGIRIIDDHLVALNGFFVMIIDGPATWDVTVTYWCLMAEVCAAWVVIRLEGHRGGNKQRCRLANWTGTFGVVMQNMTIAVTAPIYFLIHLLTSPASSNNATPDDLAISPDDSALLPHRTVLSFIIPAVLMSLPSPTILSAGAHYTWLAMWQVFPITDTIYYYITQLVLPSHNTQGASDDAVARALVAHRFILYLCCVPRTLTMAVALTPAALVPEAVRPLFEQLTPASLFVPYWPWDSPTTGNPASPVGKPELAKLFLQWDVNSAGLAILVWASFVYLSAVPDRRRLLRVVPKVLAFGVAGGPVAAATVLVMERDAAVLKRHGGGKKD